MPLPEPCVRLSPHTALQYQLELSRTVVSPHVDVHVATTTQDERFPSPSEHDDFPGSHLARSSLLFQVSNLANVMYVAIFIATAQFTFVTKQTLQKFGPGVVD